MEKRLIFLISILIVTTAFSQGPWIMTGRVHNELNWHTLTTEHYRVHYHLLLQNHLECLHSPL